MSPHIATIVRLFVIKARRERLTELAAKAKRWNDFRHDLLHDTRSLEDAVLVPLRNATLADVTRRLGARTGERAYCISTRSEIDDRELDLGEALAATIGRMEDAIVFCPRSARAYYENHEGEQFILARS